MGLLDRFKGAIFEEQVVSPTTEEPVVTEEQLAGCEVEGDFHQTAQNMFDEAMKGLDESGGEHTIHRVQEFIDTWGDGCDSTVISKMLQVARLDPGILKEDGKTRISKIQGVMSMAKSNGERVISETAQKAEEISKSINDEEMAYSNDVDVLTKKCEADIKALREKLQSDITARGQQRDQKIAELTDLQVANEKEKNDASALQSEAERKGRELIDYYNSLLKLLETE